MEDDTVVDMLKWEPDLSGLPPAARADDDPLEPVHGGCGVAEARSGGGASTSGAAEKQLMLPPLDPRQQRREKRNKQAETKGKEWFDLPAQTIDDDMKRELRVLRLRGTFDPKRFYKRFDDTKFPKHFHIGTVVESAQDFYSSRIPKAQRKQTLTDEILADPAISSMRKRRYDKLQAEATRWSRGRKQKVQRRKPKPKH